MKNFKYYLIYSLLLSYCLLSFGTNSLLAEEHSVNWYIAAQNVNFRSAPSTSAPFIAWLQLGQPFTLLETAEPWAFIKLADNRTGWVDQAYIHNNLELSGKIVLFAESLLNTRYRYGGATPEGFDCSGFVMYIFKNFGFQLPRSSATQINTGIQINKADLIIGDLVFFKTLGSTVINHVGIYLGSGNFIHASSGFGAVRVNTLLSGYYNNCYYSARRLL